MEMMALWLRAWRRLTLFDAERGGDDIRLCLDGAVCKCLLDVSHWNTQHLQKRRAYVLYVRSTRYRWFG